jgi:SRSO17 transposase
VLPRRPAGTWHWGLQAEGEFDELMHQSNTDAAEMMKALCAFLGENDMMAYLTMMANRLLELHRCSNPPARFSCTATRRAALG